jgi:hypothetical protein
MKFTTIKIGSQNNPLVIEQEVEKPYVAIKKPNWFSHLWGSFINSLITTSELKIRPSFDHTSELAGWDVYDPHTGKSYWFTDKENLLAWLDQRH